MIELDKGVISRGDQGGRGPLLELLIMFFLGGGGSAPHKILVLALLFKVH